MINRKKQINKREIHIDILLFIICTLFLLTTFFMSAESFADRLLAYTTPALSTGAFESEPVESLTKITLSPKEDAVLSDSARTMPLLMQADDKPSILIYHTHTLEAYTPTEKYPYIEHGGYWRTNDNTRNIVTVGEVLADELRSYGFNVIHDTTNHEPPKLSTAYERSLATMKQYKDKYPSLVMYIDLHRDASGEAGTGDVCTVNGEKTARIMFVVGTGKGATGTGFPEMPDFESNYALAASLTAYLRGIDKTLVRDIRVKTGRYNQHISSHCLLAEIGHNRNTLEEAMSAAKYLAEAIANEAGQ